MHDRNTLPAGPPRGADEQTRLLLRMRQIAMEIDRALSADRLDVVKRASRLLIPTLDAYRQHAGTAGLPSREAREVVRQTIDVLNRCESALEASMAAVQRDLKRLLAGRTIVVRMRKRTYSTGGRRLDISQ